MMSDEALQKRMEYMQDVAGWKSIIFLPFQFAWQCIIMISALYVFITSINRVTYKIEEKLEFSTGYFCDCLYFCDTLFSVLHHALTNTRKLKNYKTRPWILILIDSFSLIPFELIFIAVYISQERYNHEFTYYFFLNRTLRIYRIYYYFNEYEMSVNSLKLGIIYSSLQLNIYAICITHIATAIYHWAKSDDEVKDMSKSPIKDIFIDEVNMYFLISHTFVGDSSNYNTPNKRICFVIFMIVGHIYFYGVTLPKIMFAFQKRHRTFFDFWNRFKRLTMFVNNVIENEALEKKTLNMFRTVWTYGKGDFEPRLLQSYPTNMRKNAYSDIYWDVLRHSELLQNVSRSCKRSLALKIIGDFYVPNTIFWDLEENKNIILYLASGIIQIMAEENEKSPIMSFSGGTILGETSIFYPGKSKAILRVASFSEIHILRAKDFFQVIKDYPKDRKIVQHNLNLRLTIARMTQIRRKELSKVIISRDSGALGKTTRDEVDSIKWIKQQFRQITAMEEVQSKFGKEYFGASQLRNQHLNELKTGIDHTSIYLPLLNLGDDIEVITDQTCLKTTIPWVIDPNSPFTRHWRYLILLLIVFCCVMYPLYIAWWPRMPQWLLTLSALISMFYLCDIFIQISTAIKTKDEFIAKSGHIFMYRLKRLSFYADFISAFPYLIIIRCFSFKLEDLLMRISVAISLLKVYRLVVFLDEWCQTLKGRFSVRVMIKHLFYTLLLSYWSAALLHLCDVRCILWSCERDNWYREDLERKYPCYENLASMYYTLTYLLGVPSVYSYTQTFPTAVFVVISLLVMQFIWSAWFGEFAGSYMSESLQKIEFKNLLQSIIQFMNDRKIVGRIMKRVLDTVQFQWVYDCGDYLTHKRAMLEDLPLKLKTEVNNSTIFKVLRTSEAFQSEDDSFIWHLCMTGSRLALPAGSIVVTYGTQTQSLYTVYKGYLQVNSFLPKDIVEGVANPTLYGPGKIVPIIIAFNQMPSGVTARALTDCELIAIPLEALLNGLITNNSFKDFLDAIKEVDLQPFKLSKLVFSRVGVGKTTQKEDSYYSEPFAKLGAFGWLVRCLLMGTSINGGGKNYISWELFRVITFVVEATAWPLAFILPNCRGRVYLVYVLLGLESFTWFDFYIKMHLGYYNKKGIYISHPLSTFSHYIGRSLILEILVFLPYLHSIYMIVTDPSFKVADAFVLCHCIVRIFALYRVFLFTVSFSEMGTSVNPKTLGFLVMAFVGLNCFIVLKIWSEVQWTCQPNGTVTFTFDSDSWVKALNIKNIDTFPKMYIIMFYCVVMMIHRGDAFFTNFTVEILISEIVLTIVGIVVSLLIMAFFLSRKTGSKMNFIVYQYHMKSLTNFLKVEKAEDHISTEVINHFEHEWEKKKGEDLHEVFSRFPDILHEDMMFPVYRKTFLGVPCFKNANDGFFRSLSRTFVEVHFRMRSVISFEKAVHNDIFFVLNGLCHVKEDDTILGPGSVMGDIKGNGIMRSNIYALTHVVLLAITSEEFFVILNNFGETEAAFFDAVKDVDDYVKSDYDIPENVIPRHTTEWMTPHHKVECQFEIVKDKRHNQPASEDKKARGKTKGRYMNPNSPAAKILLMVFVLDAIATALVVPTIVALKLRNFNTTVIVHFLDAIWFFKIVATLRTAYIAPDTGNQVTDLKTIFKHYIKASDGLIIDVLCIIPFEYIFIIVKHYYSSWHWNIESYGYSARLLRVFSLWIRVKKERRKLSLRERTKWFIIIMRQIIVFNILTALNLIVTADSQVIDKSREIYDAGGIVEALTSSFLSMFTIYAGKGLDIIRPTNFIQLTFNIFIAVYASFEKTLLTSDVLSIINGSLFVKTEKLYKMQIMEKFLEVRDISPALRKNLMKYACDILLHFNGEVDPWFLKTAPYHLRVEIAKDLYLDYLHACHAFRGTPHDFLKQLPARFQRHVFFPSDVITEKGDVDCCMYFVHNGEVASIESDPIYHGLDYETGQFRVGDFFGLEQGLAHAVPQKTTYRALTKVVLLILNYYEWEDLRAAFPEAVRIIKRNMVIQTTL